MMNTTKFWIWWKRNRVKPINLIDAKLLEHGVAHFRTSPSADKYFIVSTPRIRKSVLEKHLYKIIKRIRKRVKGWDKWEF